MDADRRSSKGESPGMRRLVKALALTIALLVLLAGLAVAVFFSLGDAQHRWIATRVVSTLLDSPVEFRGGFSLDLGRPSTLTARDIWIGVAPDGRSLGTPVEGRLGVVKVRLDPMALLRGTVLIHRLVVESAEVELMPAEPDEEKVGTSWRERLRTLERSPVFYLETARLSEMRVTRRAAPGVPPLFLKLEDVSLEKEGGIDGRVLLNGAVTVDDHPLALEGEFGSLAAAQDPSTPYPSRLAILHPAFGMTLEGHIDDPLSARGLDLRAKLQVPDLAALDDVLPTWPWPEGQLTIASEVSGSIEDLRLIDLIVDFSDPEGRSVKISGEIGDAFEMREASLDLTARLPRAKPVLDRVLGTDLPELDDVFLTTRLVAEDHTWRAEDIDAKIASEAGWSLAASGTAAVDAADDELALDSLALDLDLSATDTAILASLFNRKIASLGPLAAKGTLSGEGDSLELADLGFRVGEEVRLLLTGSGTAALDVGDDELALDSLALDFDLSAADTAILASLFNRKIASLGPLAASGTLSGKGGSLELADLGFQVGEDGRLLLTGSGTAALEAKDDDLTLDSLALDLDLSADNTAILASLFDREIANLGPLAASGTLSGEGDSLELADFGFRVGKEGSLLLTGAGRVDLAGVFEAPDGRAADRLGFDLTAEVEGRGEVLAGLLLKQDLPDPGLLRATFQVTGDGRKLRLVPQDFSFDGASGSALMLGAIDENSGVTLVLDKRLKIRDVRFPLLATAPGTKALRPWLGDRYLPDLGEITGRAVLVGGGGSFGLHDFLLKEGPESQPRIKAAGRIDMQGRKRIDLSADFWADLAALANPFLTVPLRPLGGAKGHLELSNADGSLGIEKLELATVQDGDARLRLTGVIDDIARLAEADINLDASLARLELIRQAFEPEWDGAERNDFWQQSASFEGRFLASEPTRFASLEGSGNLGSGGLIVDLRLHDLDTTPAIAGAISMSELNLRDFGIHLAGEGDKPAGTGPKRLFSDTPLGLSRLEELSIDLTISVDDIVDPLVSLQKIDTRLVWNEKRFALQPTVFVYEGGHVNLVLSTDFTQDPPTHRLLIVANDMNLGNFLSRFREGEPLVEGKLNVDAGLEARGDSPHEIASSLSGDVALALEEGRLNHVNLRLLAPRTFQWFTAATGGRSYTILSCVVARFDVAEGIAKSDSLYVRAPDVRLTGAGSIDFGKEELDIVLAAPRPALAPPGMEKPVRFHGNLADPEVQASAVGHAANLGITTAGVVLMPMIFVPWLAASAMFSQLDEEGEDSPCLINPESAKENGKDAVPTGDWIGTDDGWTLTLSVEGRKVRGNIERKMGGSKIKGKVSGKIRSDGVFEGWTLGRQVGGRKIYGRMPELDMWSGQTGGAARFTMKAAAPHAEN